MTDTANTHLEQDLEIEPGPATGPVHLDGSAGEGGGQVLRSALALSAVTGRPFTIRGIRASRVRPGLMRQHLTAARAAAAICGATLEGDEIGSNSLRFEPGAVRAGDHVFAIGTAGSTTLVLQTVLPPLLLADGPSTVRISGGTHNPQAPTVMLLQRCFLPALRRMGADVDLELVRYGFQPAGGGEILATVRPRGPLARVELLRRGPLVRRVAVAVVANLDPSIAERELREVAARLGWSANELRMREVTEAHGPGNVLHLVAEAVDGSEVVDGFGVRGLRAEIVARRAAGRMAEWLEGDHPVGHHLADQLLVPMALAGGGVFRTGRPSSHLRTNLHTVTRFVGLGASIRAVSDATWEVRLGT